MVGSKAEVLAQQQRLCPPGFCACVVTCSNQVSLKSPVLPLTLC